MTFGIVALSALTTVAATVLVKEQQLAQANLELA